MNGHAVPKAADVTVSNRNLLNASSTEAIWAEFYALFGLMGANG